METLRNDPSTTATEGADCEPTDATRSDQLRGTRRHILKRLWLGLVTALGVGAFLRVPSAQAGPKDAVTSGQGQGLEGSWILRAIATVPGFEPALFINLATATSDGSVIASSPFPSLSSAHGAWVRTGNREFEMTAIYSRADQNENFVGISKVRVRLTLNATKDRAHGGFIQEGFDVDGNLIRVIEAAAEAERIKVEPFSG
jgi:hypothetical protein